MNNEIVNKIKGEMRVGEDGGGGNGEKAHKTEVSSVQFSVFSGEKEGKYLTADNADGARMGGEGIKNGEAEPNVEQTFQSGTTSNAEHRIEEDKAALVLRAYQMPVVWDHTSGIVVLHWARQIGKSYALAAWAVWRLMTRPGRLVTVLSNSKENGAEFLLKCADVCRLHNTRFEIDGLPPLDFEDMRMELRFRNRGKMGRIKVLAANPRTARGFSGDLILDEFAFHENAEAIWEAAEPILASNKDFLCRIASTGNGKHNLFYRMVEGFEAAEEKVSSVQCSVFSGEKKGKYSTADNADGARMGGGGIRNGEAGPNIEHRTSNAQHRIEDDDDCAVASLARNENALAAELSGVAGAEILPDRHAALRKEEKAGATGDVNFYVEEFEGGLRKVSFQPRRQRGGLEVKYTEDGAKSGDCSSAAAAS